MPSAPWRYAASRGAGRTRRWWIDSTQAAHSAGWRRGRDERSNERCSRMIVSAAIQVRRRRTRRQIAQVRSVNDPRCRCMTILSCWCRAGTIVMTAVAVITVGIHFDYRSAGVPTFVLPGNDARCHRGQRRTSRSRSPTLAIPLGRGGYPLVRICRSPEAQMDARRGDARGLRGDPCGATANSTEGGTTCP